MSEKTTAILTCSCHSEFQDKELEEFSHVLEKVKKSNHLAQRLWTLIYDRGMQPFRDNIASLFCSESMALKSGVAL